MLMLKNHLFLAILAIAALLEAPSIKANETGDADILNGFQALQTYAKSLESFEARRRNDLSKDFLKNKDSLNKNQSKATSEEIQSLAKFLNKAILNYKSEIKNKASLDIDPSLILNFSVAYARLGDLYKDTEPDTSRKNYEESLNQLGPLIASQKSDLIRDQALYLKATLLESLGQLPTALATWSLLGKSTYKSEYQIYALVALGDIYFGQNDFSASLRSFQDAERNLGLVPTLSKSNIATKIQYRISWSAFRAGQHSEAIRSAVNLLIQPSMGTNQVELNQYKKDAINIASDSLYYQNSPKELEQFFKQKNYLASNSLIGYKVLQRLSASSLHSQVVRISTLLFESNPLPVEAPKILNILANSYRSLGKTQQWQDTMENLAMMLPAKSLWRSNFGHLIAETKEMETLAEAAAIALSSSFYSNGLTSNNPKSFSRAAAIYHSLVQYKPNDTRTSDWKLKIAHCQFFSQKFNSAQEKYQHLADTEELNQEQLELALYQSIKSIENQWRQEYSRNIGQRPGENSTKSVQDLASELGKAIDRYHERFPNQPRSTDLLLVGASVYRDMNQLEKASEYLQRVLIQDANPSQRALAIRGILFAKLKTNPGKSVVEIVGNFLKLENWKILGANLYHELNGVLSTALIEEAERLRSQGLVTEAGSLLTDYGSRFTDLPELERIQRDGAYYYAISGHWRLAETGAIKYLESGNLKFRADMKYLAARSAEYQLKIKDAATHYFKLATDFPEYNKSRTALERAESLAAAEGMTDLSTNIALFKSANSGSKSEKLRTLDQAIELSISANKFSQAEKLARGRLRISETLAEKLGSRIKIAEIAYLSGSRQEALDELKILDQQIRTSSSRLPRTDSSILIGKVNLLRGQHLREKFEEYRIDVDPQQLVTRIRTKSELFSAMEKNLDTVISMGTAYQASEARFHLATAAESLANEIAGIPVKNGIPVTLKSSHRNRSTIERLQDLAQKYFSQNVLLSRQNPSIYANNEWIKKSSGRINNEISTKVEQKFLDIAPIASQGGQISQWNLDGK